MEDLLCERLVTWTIQQNRCCRVKRFLLSITPPSVPGHFLTEALSHGTQQQIKGDDPQVFPSSPTLHKAKKKRKQTKARGNCVSIYS